MRKSAKKLTLSRETLRDLTNPGLRTAAGGGTGVDPFSVINTNCTGCDMSPLCPPTVQVGCQITQ